MCIRDSPEIELERRQGWQHANRRRDHADSGLQVVDSDPADADGGILRQRAGADQHRFAGGGLHHAAVVGGDDDAARDSGQRVVVCQLCGVDGQCNICPLYTSRCV